MPAENEVLDYPRRTTLPGLSERPLKAADKSKEEGDEAECRAFGFLRGTRDRALMVEFRLANGDKETFPYSWLGPVRYNPSVGLLLRFTGDLTTLVLVRGSNLDGMVGGGATNLTDRGLQRHRVVWVREMAAGETAAAGRGEPTVDAIIIAEFESQDELREWLGKTAPNFLR